MCMKTNAGCLSSVASACTVYCPDLSCSSVAWATSCFFNPLPGKERPNAQELGENGSEGPFRRIRVSLKLHKYFYTAQPVFYTKSQVSKNAPQGDLFENAACTDMCKLIQFANLLFYSILIFFGSAQCNTKA